MQQGPYIFSVREVTRYIKTTLERERALQGMLVRGEISNLKYHTSGHLYFTLKDDVSQLPCVMWRDRVMAQTFRCENGMRVLAEGNITLYERGGYYQLNAYSLQADGVGDLFLAFEQLKRKLEMEGLFDEARKRRIPAIPRRIALISSPTGAVVHDFLTVSGRRWQGRHLTLLPTAVQGPQAPAEIVHALQLAARLPDADVIVLARGGGSFEELACFNDEGVARAIANSPLPVVSAIGHETDYTIADFVADLRAPTPSAAAELVVPDLRGITDFLSATEQRIYSRMRGRLANEKRALEIILTHGALRNPGQLIRERQQTLDLLSERIFERLQTRLLLAKSHLEKLEDRIAALDPRGVLLRGYTLVSDSAGVLLTSTADARRARHLSVQFFDGQLQADVVEDEHSSTGMA